MSVSLDGFKEFDFSVGSPSLSVTKKGVTFDKNTTVLIGRPRYISVLVNYDTKQIAVTGCDTKTKNAIKYYNGRKVESVRINRGPFKKMLCEFAGIDVERGFKCDGEFNGSGMVIFSLSDAKEIDRGVDEE